MMNFMPDIRTLLLTATVISMFLMFAMLLFWRTQKTYAGFGFFVASSSCLAVVFLLYSGRGMIPDTLSIALANLLVIVAGYLRLYGFRRFFGKVKQPVLSMLVLGATSLLLLYYSGSEGTPFLRNVVISFGCTYLCITIAYELFTGDLGIGRMIPRIIGGVHLVYALIMDLRLLHWFLVPEARNILAQELPNVVFFISEPVAQILFTMGIFTLNNQRLAQELVEYQRKLERLATVDSLTGVLNQRTLINRGEEETFYARERGSALSLMMMDIDRFKGVNDTYGHAAGDKVLTETVDLMKRNLGMDGVIFRLGGDEFMALLPGMDADVAFEKAEQLRAEVGRRQIEWEGKAIQVSLSIGVVELSERDESFEQFLRRGDLRLYKAKHLGRDRTEGEHKPK